MIKGQDYYLVKWVGWPTEYNCHEHDSHDRLRPGGHASIRRY
jgi:hypothetical protein